MQELYHDNVTFNDFYARTSSKQSYLEMQYNFLSSCNLNES